jgi:hypothetical protein
MKKEKYIKAVFIGKISNTIVRESKVCTKFAELSSMVNLL